MSEERVSQHLFAQAQEAARLIEQMARRSYEKAWLWLLGELGVSQAELERRTRLTAKTIRRITHRVKKATLNQVVLMCLGLHLPGAVSLYLLERTGYVLGWEFPEDVAYRTALCHLYDRPVAEVQEFLRDQGVKSL